MHCRILINGVVQGIGFRPFVYNLALKHNLKGYVLNRGDAGVEIQVIGGDEFVTSFIKDLKTKKPTLARYEKFKVKLISSDSSFTKFKTFKISKSSLKRSSEGSYIPPDLPICDKCLSEMKSDPRRMNYAFSSCVDCGPRFTVITSLPYDRPRTVMDEFPLCPDCLQEYKNPKDRRFHAQTTCCWYCGPNYYLSDKFGNIIINHEEFQDNWIEIPHLLNEGKIIAIKGIGGTHIACQTSIDDPIIKLRQWKGARGNKPFAVMASDLANVRKFAHCSSLEAKYLQSLARPIVLLEKNQNYSLSPLISPGLHNIGVLLPYAGIQHLITENITDPALIMTSGNPSNIPIFIENKLIQSQLSSVVDYFLLHDRKIFQRADDSVIRLHVLNNTGYPALIRRSRGYIPEPIQLPWSSKTPPILALGAEMYAVAALGIRGRCFPTQHIGHMTTVENVEFFNDSINHMKRLLGVEKFAGIGGDLHPQFLTTQIGQTLASEMKIPFFQFQHHFAHLGALALDAKVNPEEEIICVTLDGTGYGEDGTIWGGEILLGNFTGYKRLAHLENQILFGGDKAVLEPYRFLLGILLSSYTIEEVTTNLQAIPWLSWIPKLSSYKLIAEQLAKIISSEHVSQYNFTSSCGRILDSISILLGVAKHRTYEGEPAIKLESFAEKALGKTFDIDLKLPSKPTAGGMIEIQTTELINELWERIKQKQTRSFLALAAEQVIARKFAELAIELAEKHGISKIGLSGGVAYNRVIFTEFHKYISSHDSYSFISHKNIPCGDGGVAIGQIPLIQVKVDGGQ
ncbi:MAG: carbamoyltransferase HypF [Candidatus Hodarchaeota archaeon]